MNIYFPHHDLDKRPQVIELQEYIVSLFDKLLKQTRSLERKSMIMDLRSAVGYLNEIVNALPEDNELLNKCSNNSLCFRDIVTILKGPDF